MAAVSATFGSFPLAMSQSLARSFALPMGWSAACLGVRLPESEMPGTTPT